MTRAGRGRAFALVVLLILPSAAGVGAPPGPAAAQDASPARVTLAAIDPFATSGTAVRWSVVVEHDGDAPWTRVEVVAELHGALGSRSALRTALAGSVVPPVVRRSVVDAPGSAPLVPGGVARISGAVPLTGAALSGRTNAVHPLRLRVLADGLEVGRIDTAIVRIGTAPIAPLATTLVWPFTAPPARAPDGDVSAVLDPLTAAGGHLDTLVTALERVTVGGAEAPLAGLAPGVASALPAHLVEDLTLRADGVPTGPEEDLPDGPPPSDADEAIDEGALRAALLLQRVRRAALALPHGPLVTPYADADVGRLLASGVELQPLAVRALLDGGGRIPTLVGRDPSPVVLLDAPVSPATLDLLPGGTVLLPHAAIEAPALALDVPLGEPVRTLRSPTGRPVTALIGDPYLTLALGTSTRLVPGDPVRAAHEVLVRTAMVHLEAPGRVGRTLVLLPPPDFDPDRRFATELLARLGDAPWLDPLPPDALATTAATGTVLEPARLLDTTADPLPGRLVSALTSTRRDLELLAGAVDRPVGAPDDVIPVGGRALRDASDELLRATSRAFAGDVDRAVALLAGVRAGVDEAFGTITLAVNDVTLTDRDGTVPVALVHSGGVPIRVRVELSGPAALTWTDGRVREVVLGSDATRAIEVPVRSGATGRFPVTVRVTDPSGTRVLASDVIGVRATAVAGPALALIGAIVLLLTVIGTLRQRRRGLAWRTAGGDERTAEGVAR